MAATSSSDLVQAGSSRTFKFGFESIMTTLQVNYLWIALLIVAGVTFVGVLLLRRPRIEYAELGTMNEQWLAEQRANDRPY